jgi:hypothetical protein
MTGLDVIDALSVLVVWTAVSIPVALLVGRIFRLSDPQRDCDDLEADR